MGKLFLRKVEERSSTNNILNDNLFIEFLEYFLEKIQLIISNDPLFSENQNYFFINLITRLKDNLKIYPIKNDDYSEFAIYLDKYKRDITEIIINN